MEAEIGEAENGVYLHEPWDAITKPPHAMLWNVVRGTEKKCLVGKVACGLLEKAKPHSLVQSVVKGRT